jgi:hypothetical protein
MNMLWWILGFACAGLVLLAVVGIVVLALRDSRRKKYVLDNGDHTFGWLVQANSKLFEEGVMDLPALVLISPDAETNADEDFMIDLADKIMDLKGLDADDCDDDDEVFVAELMADETYVEGKRDKLPKRFAGGRKVYLVHIFIYRDHLPRKRLEKRKIACAIIWDEPESLVCTRPAPKRRRRRDDDDE